MKPAPIFYVVIPGERARWNKWRKFDRVFSDGRTEVRWIQEIIFGRRGLIEYWIITTDPTTVPPNSTCYIMTKVPGIKYKQVGNLYGLRNWVVYGLSTCSKIKLSAVYPRLSANTFGAKNKNLKVGLKIKIMPSS